MRYLQLMAFAVLVCANAVLFMENRHTNERLVAMDTRVFDLESAMAPQVARLKVLEQSQEAMQPKLDLIGMIIKDQQPRVPPLVHQVVSVSRPIMPSK